MRSVRAVLAAMAQPSPAALGVTLMVATLVTLWAAWGGMVEVYARYLRGPTWVYDIDTGMIRAGLLKTPHLLDTLKWWTGPWVLEEAPYYRPLTSYVFWIEWKLLGEREWLYVFPSMAGYLAANSAFVALVYKLAQRVRLPLPAVAGIAAAIAFAGLLSPFRHYVVQKMVEWKNQPDTLALICCSLALLCYLRAQEGKRGLFGACGWYLAACGFKEIALPLPAICLALEFLESPVRPRREIVRRLIPLALSGALFLALRHFAIGGLGYAPFSNEAWVGRTLMHFAGPFDAAFLTGQWIASATAIWTLLIGLLLVWMRSRGEVSTKQPLTRVIAAHVGLLNLGWVAFGTVAWRGQSDEFASASLLDPFTWMSGLLFCFEDANLTRAVASLAFLLPFVILKSRRGVIAVAVIWTAAFLAPLALSPGPVHRYFIPQTGYLMLNALAAGAVAEFLIRRLAGSPDPEEGPESRPALAPLV